MSATETDSRAITKQIVGQCVEISEKNGWTSFSVDVGTQYPVRLSTKLDAIVQAGRAVGSDVATWTFKESEGKENPNKPGTKFTNRYLDKVEPGSVAENTAGSTAPAQQPTQQTSAVPTPHHDPIAPADRDRAIVRQTCLKAASALYGGLGTAGPLPQREDGLLGEDPVVASVIAAAARFEIWVYRDIDEVPF